MCLSLIHAFVGYFFRMHTPEALLRTCIVRDGLRKPIGEPGPAKADTAAWSEKSHNGVLGGPVPAGVPPGEQVKDGETA